jgi:hypothetical protein
MPFRALLERVFNQSIQCSPIPHFCCAGYMTAPRTKDEPHLPLSMKNRLGESFDPKLVPIDIKHSTLERV